MTDQRVLLPFRVTSAGWRNGLTVSTTKGTPSPSPWGGITSDTSKGWGASSWKAALQKKPLRSWCTSCTGAGNGPLQQEEKANSLQCCIRQSVGSRSREVVLHFYPALVGTSRRAVSVLGSSVQQRHGHAGVSPTKGRKDGAGVGAPDI